LSELSDCPTKSYDVKDILLVFVAFFTFYKERVRQRDREPSGENSKAVEKKPWEFPEAATQITRFKPRLVIATREPENVKKSDAEHNQSIRRR
jgi:hypothetical protein